MGTSGDVGEMNVPWFRLFTLITIKGFTSNWRRHLMHSTADVFSVDSLNNRYLYSGD